MNFDKTTSRKKEVEEPLISLMTRIFMQIEFLDAPLRQAQGAQGTAHELTWIGWREMDFGHKSFKNLS